MFDVSFTELMVIALVALVVIGPERLPRVARTAGHLLGRLQRYVNTVKSDINREMHVEDLKNFEQRIKSQVGEIESSVKTEVSSIETDVGAIAALHEGATARVGTGSVPDAGTADSPAPAAAAQEIRQA